jgi:hypothetical protein
MCDSKPIYRLPELTETQDWACDGGCSHIQPVLYRNIYAKSRTTDGLIVRELSEHYYTCQRGHVLYVWDENEAEPVELDAIAYKPHENERGWTLQDIDILKSELDHQVSVFTGSMGLPDSFAKAAFEIKLKNGEMLEITQSYLNEMRAFVVEQNARQIA